MYTRALQVEATKTPARAESTAAARAPSALSLIAAGGRSDPVQAAASALGDRLVTARRAREMTQIELAQAADVGVSTVACLEAGRTGVSIGNLLKVLRTLGLLGQVDELLNPARDPEVTAFALKTLNR